MAEPLVRMERISKYFGRVQALDNVDFNVERQEIVGLLGDNGAGKSTLIKVLSGALRATSGDIYVRGEKVLMRSTSDAIAQGIETIYQDSALVTQLSIARNLFLGREPIKGAGLFNRMDTALMERVQDEFAPATWQAFRRHALEGEPAVRVAEALGLSLNSVLLAKSRVLKRLRQEAAGLVE